MPRPVAVVPAHTNFGGPDYLDVEDMLFRARMKLAALSHLLSQYHGEVDFPNEAAHGLGHLLDDIYDTLQAPDAREKGVAS